ncbi:MAG: CHASE2 domain-containing protein [Cyanobacteria bacterium P01_F01_bin.33]
MSQVVTLKIIDGSFEWGFSVILQIGPEGRPHECEQVGRLAAAPRLPFFYKVWQKAYRKLGLSFRLEPIGGQEAISHSSHQDRVQTCLKAAAHLHREFNLWLRGESFRPLREMIWQRCQTSERVRLIVQTADLEVQQLPWCAWEGLESYPLAEVALSMPNFAVAPHVQRNGSDSRNEGARVLALMGGAAGIDPYADIAEIERHADMDVVVASTPTLRELTDRLWSRPWDVLLFSGHSSSDGGSQSGWMALDNSTRIAISDLKGALRRSIQQGLQLAIFNSCDGLGLARQLAELNVPQAIVMRAPVPDCVARAFLSYFLSAFARSGALYPAVREARERLEGWEQDFPCASWLPVIIQNPAVSPSSWDELCGRRSMRSSRSQEATVADVSGRKRQKLSIRKLWKTRGLAVALASALATVLIGASRVGGMLESVELAAFDRVLALRPAETLDPRLLVVTLDAEDIREQPQGGKQGSLSDEALLLLLEKLESYQPRVIGLDIYRDYSTEIPALAKRIAGSNRLIVTCKVSDTKSDDSGVDPPPEASIERLGFADFVPDNGFLVRRHLLALTPEPASACATQYAFSTQLAFRYLVAEGIMPSYTPAGVMQLGNREFVPLSFQRGAYTKADLWGYQLLLNYRTSASGELAVQQVSLTDLLADRVDPNFIRDRVILIGTIDRSFGDVIWDTPISKISRANSVPGVLLQAQMVSQVLAAVKDDRPILQPLPAWVDGLWVLGGACMGGILAIVRRHSLPYTLAAVAIASVGLGGIAVVTLSAWGWWVPVVPVVLAAVTSASFIEIRFVHYQQ